SRASRDTPARGRRARQRKASGPLRGRRGNVGSSGFLVEVLLEAPVGRVDVRGHQLLGALARALADGGEDLVVLAGGGRHGEPPPQSLDAPEVEAPHGRLL